MNPSNGGGTWRDHAGNSGTLAFPAGRLADRFGRGRVFVAGHVALLVVYAMLWQSFEAMAGAIIAVLLLGTYYAMTDGVLAAAASGLLTPQTRGTGLAILGTAVSLSRLAAAVLFGWTWSQFGPSVALAVFASALVLAILVALRSRGTLERSAP